ncbi:hypothetical protein V5H41_29820, partial [Salmonella enterica]
QWIPLLPTTDNALMDAMMYVIISEDLHDRAFIVADQWIPLLPTTDNALMDAMMYVIISEDLHDRAFI